MKRKILFSIILLTSFIISLNSCKKKEPVDNETQSVVDNAICEQQFMAIQPVVNQKGITEKGIKRMGASCETFSLIAGDTTDVNPRDGIYDALLPVTFQIDYGTVGCIGADGVYRTGKIKITTSKKWSVYNNQVTIDLLGFVVNGVSFDGQLKLSKPDSVTSTIEVINGHCASGNWWIGYAGTKTIKQIGGFNTKNDESDDVISITGNSTGVNRNGVNFSTSITNPLIKKSNCKFFSSGTLDLTPDGFKTRTVDYGSGTCDDDATYTVNGQTISFKLK
jgi:hypothetical protein